MFCLNRVPWFHPLSQRTAGREPKNYYPPVWEEVRNIRQQKRINCFGGQQAVSFSGGCKRLGKTTEIDGWISVAGFNDQSL